MAASNKSYPFPVLGNEDDIEGRFEPTLSCALSPDSVSIESRLDLENDTIERLIDQGRAAFFIEIECGSTFYREIYKKHEQDVKIDIDTMELRDRVDVAFYVCATADMEDYNPAGIHPELAGEPISVEKGDVLADGGGGSFMADKTFDPLKAPVSSFMRVKKGNNKEEPMSIDYGDDQIIIRLSKDDYEKYEYACNYAPSTLHSSLVLPALVDALYTIEHDGGKYQGVPWCDRIQQICRERGYDTEDPISTAQKMLGGPIGRGLAEVGTIAEDNGEDAV